MNLSEQQRDEVGPTPWRLAHADVSVGPGFNDERAFVVDANGKEVSGTIHHARRFTSYATEETRAYQRIPGRPYHEETDPFPYSANAHLLRAAPDLLAAAEQVALHMELNLTACGDLDAHDDPCVHRVLTDAIESARARGEGAGG